MINNEKWINSLPRKSINLNHVFLWSYVFLSTIILSSMTANLGIAVRQKWMIMPIIIYLLLTIIKEHQLKMRINKTLWKLLLLEPLQSHWLTFGKSYSPVYPWKMMYWQWQYICDGKVFRAQLVFCRFHLTVGFKNLPKFLRQVVGGG